MKKRGKKGTLVRKSSDWEGETNGDTSVRERRSTREKGETGKTAFGVGEQKLCEGVERGTGAVLDGEDEVAERGVRVVEKGEQLEKQMVVFLVGSLLGRD